MKNDKQTPLQNFKNDNALKPADTSKLSTDAPKPDNNPSPSVENNAVKKEEALTQKNAQASTGIKQ